MKPPATPAPPRAPTLEEICKEDWHRCTDNAQLVNNWKGWALVQVKCKRAANELAKYGTPDWGGWLYPTFSTFQTGTDYVTSGVAVVIEKDVKFQNGYGAMVRSEARCTFDLRSDQVIDVVVTPW